MLSPIKSPHSTKKTEESTYSTANISIIDVDEIPNNDLMEFIDLTSPTKNQISENAPMHHKKQFLKQYLSDQNAVLLSVNDGSDDAEEEAVGFNPSEMD